MILHLGTYKATQVSDHHYTVSLPSLFSQQQSIQPGQLICCYIGDKGEVIYRTSETNQRGRVLIRSYKAQRSGPVGRKSVKISLPRVFRDACKLQPGDILHAHMGDDEILFSKERLDGKKASRQRISREKV